MEAASTPAAAALGCAPNETESTASRCPGVGEEHEEGPPWTPDAAARPDTSRRLALGYAQDGTKSASSWCLSVGEEHAEGPAWTRAATAAAAWPPPHYRGGGTG